MQNNTILDKAIRRIADFPKPGILFYDITSVLTNPDVFHWTILEAEKKYAPLVKSGNINAVAAVESRGFLFASPLALTFNLPLILIRKKGKLPGDVFRASYKLEYGEAEIEVHKADLKKSQKILLIDDLIATGGTLDAGKRLVAQGGAEVTEIFGIIGLSFLGYKDFLSPTPVTTLIEYESE